MNSNRRHSKQPNRSGDRSDDRRFGDPQSRDDEPALEESGSASELDTSPSRSETRCESASATKPVLEPPTARVWKRNGPRFWALPDKNLGWWILRENDTGGVNGLTEGSPSVITPGIAPEQRGAVEACCHDFIAHRLRDRMHEDGFNLLKRVMLAGVFCVAGLIGLRFLEVFDFPILFAALGYSGYVAVRYGNRFLRALDAVQRAPARFTGDAFVVSRLAERIAQALAFRCSLPAEKRGLSPDEELLDANAYRKLIREGVTTREELAALGKALESRLELTLNEPKRLSELSRTEGLQADSAALYRDLALAAAEITFDAEFA